MDLNKELQKQWSWPHGRQSYFSADDHSKRSFLLVMQGMLYFVWLVQSMGPGERLRWKWWWVLSRKVFEPSSDVVMEKRTKARGQDTPKEPWRQTRPQQQYTISKSGFEAWRKMLGKMMWEMTKCVIMGLSGRKPALSMWGRGSRWCRRQGAPWLMRDTSSGSSSSGGGSSEWGSE